MGKNSTEELSGVSRPAEEAYLEETLAVIRKNMESYSREVAQMQESIDTMLEHYHSGDVEIWTQLNNTITLHDHMKRSLSRNEKALKKPYFGRILFHDETLDKEESLYIGRGGISRDATHQMVVDWRAPVANAYYENGLGKCSYQAPDGGELPIDLKLKRTFEIENGRLNDYFDTEVIANDELLTKYLAKNKQAVLGEIIATIQKEQNDIIRKSPYHNLIVQGVAGSGKTTVAMHRISYILYNYQERFKPEDFYIVGSNRILLEYITGVLPDLDVYGIRQMTMEQLFVRLLYEDWDDKKYAIAENRQDDTRGKVRGTQEWFRALEGFCRRLEWRTIPRGTVMLDPRQFQEGMRDGHTGVFDLREELPEGKFSCVELVSQEAVQNYIRNNPTVSIQSKVDMLNARLMNKIKEEFLGKMKYTEAERKEILSFYRGYYGKKKWKKSIYELYEQFLEEQREQGYAVTSPKREEKTELDVYDLAALAYLYKRVKETDEISEAHHVVVDEAQDFGMMAYHVLDYCIKDCTYTIMGDVSQNIHFGYGLNDWKQLCRLLLKEETDTFGVLKKSYRNTVEIAEFAADILHHGRFADYPAEPIIRHGKQVMVRKVTQAGASGADRPAERKEFAQAAAEVCRGWQAEGLETIAVVCRDKEEAQTAAAELGKFLPVMESDLEKAVFGSGIMVLPVAYTKGLEFDAVLVWNPTRDGYPVEDGHAKLLYVAATRALHELCVLHGENLTGLIADPAPVRRNAESEEAEKAVGNRAREIADSAQLRRNAESEEAEKAVGSRTREAADSAQLRRNAESEEAGKASRSRTREAADSAQLRRNAESEEAGKAVGNRAREIADSAQLRRNIGSGNSAQNGQEEPRRSKSPWERASEGETDRRTARGIEQNAGASAPRVGTGERKQPEQPRNTLTGLYGSAKKTMQPTSALTARYGGQAAGTARPASTERPTAGTVRPKVTGAARPTTTGISRPTASSSVRQAVSNNERSAFSGNVLPTATAGGSGAASPSNAADGRKLPAFGDMPDTDKLRIPGHSRIDLSVRWVSKQADGLYVQSRGGVLRLSPVLPSVLRVSFAKEEALLPAVHPRIARKETERRWLYKESGTSAELLMDELCITVQKSTGAVSYQTRDKKLLLKETDQECRQIESAGIISKNQLYPGRLAMGIASEGARAMGNVRFFPAWKKDEKLYALHPSADRPLPLRGSARYLSDSTAVGFPMLVSDRGYGILFAADSPVFSCDLPTYGTYLCVQQSGVLDFYFFLGRDPGELL